MSADVEWRSHCRHGHPYDDGNVVVWGDGARRCRTCLRQQTREARRRYLTRLRDDANVSRGLRIENERLETAYAALAGRAELMERAIQETLDWDTPEYRALSVPVRCVLEVALTHDRPPRAAGEGSR